MKRFVRAEQERCEKRRWTTKFTNLAAPKLLCMRAAQGRTADVVATRHDSRRSDPLPKRLVAGVLVSVSDDGRFLLDDGMGVIGLFISGDFRQHQWQAGMYLMRDGEPPAIKHLQAAHREEDEEL
ncbi:hypothetical protein QQ045_010175 [Rhodiola kirilowii]